MNYHFAEPYWLLLGFIWIPMYFFYRRRRPVYFKVPSLQRFQGLDLKASFWKQHLLFIIRSLTLFFLVLALARPQSGQSEIKKRTEGLDIMLAVDTSGSMRALDFMVKGKRTNRLEVTARVLADFVSKRVDDRVGMLVFGSYAVAQVPLTLDHDVLLRYIEALKIGMVGEETAIGDAIGIATNRIKNSSGKSKIIIILTDGENTAGKLNPKEAAEAAKALGIKIYAVGVGSKDPVPYPTQWGYQKMMINLDDKLLTEIAETTHGRYFAASDTQTLLEIYKTIDKLEKSEVEVKVYHNYEEQFAVFAWPALFLLLSEVFLRLTRIRRLGI